MAHLSRRCQARYQAVSPDHDVNSQGAAPSLCTLQSEQGDGRDLQIYLHPIADPVVLQRQLVLERPLALPLQHDLVRLAADAGRHLRLEEFCDRDR